MLPQSEGPAVMTDPAGDPAQVRGSGAPCEAPVRRDTYHVAVKMANACVPGHVGAWQELTPKFTVVNCSVSPLHTAWTSGPCCPSVGCFLNWIRLPATHWGPRCTVAHAAPGLGGWSQASLCRHPQPGPQSASR